MRQSRLLAGRSCPPRGAGRSWSRPARGRRRGGAGARLRAGGGARRRARAANAPAVAPEPTFDVEAYDVDGARLIGEAEIETAVYPFLGPGQTRETRREGARGAGEGLSRQGLPVGGRGDPAQTVGDAVIRLHVIEAPIGRLRVTGSRY